MIGLGDLPGGVFSSTASDTSSGGSVVVGSSSAQNLEALRWEAGVMTGPGNLLGSGNYSSKATAVTLSDVTIRGSCQKTAPQLILDASALITMPPR